MREKLYFCICLDDEHYTEPSVCVVRTEKEAEKWCRSEIEDNLMPSESENEITVEQREDGIWMGGQNAEHFIVAKAIPLDCEPDTYICLFYHAYVGVDFFVIKMGSLAECTECMKRCVRKCAKKSAKISVYSPVAMEVDTGLEWEEYRIYLLSELMESEG